MSRGCGKWCGSSRVVKKVTCGQLCVARHDSHNKQSEAWFVLIQKNVTCMKQLMRYFGNNSSPETSSVSCPKRANKFVVDDHALKHGLEPLNPAHDRPLLHARACGRCCCLLWHHRTAHSERRRCSCCGESNVCCGRI